MDYRDDGPQRIGETRPWILRQGPIDCIAGLIDAPDGEQQRGFTQIKSRITLALKNAVKRSEGAGRTLAAITSLNSQDRRVVERPLHGVAWPY